MTITACRSCASTELEPVLNLGNHRLSDFRDDDSEPPRFPLNLVLCDGCGLAQLDSTTPRAALYHGRYGFKSGVSEVIRRDLNSVVHSGLRAFIVGASRPPATWLDIASNDGTLLSHVPATTFRVGVDPLAQFADEARQHANEIRVEYFDPTTFGDQTFDVVTSVSMFYDIDDVNSFVDGVKRVMAPDGVWVIQQNYALDMLVDVVFDNICHEHVTYFSLSSLTPLLARHGLEVNRVYTSPINGGCIRTVVSREGTYPVHGGVFSHLKNESLHRVDHLHSWTAFAAFSWERINKVRDFVAKWAAGGTGVAIYGASTRGATIWQAADLGYEHFRYAVERQPAKVGKWMSAVGVPIVSEERLRDDTLKTGQPEFAVVGPWFFRSAIDEREMQDNGYLRNGGRLVYPLPELSLSEMGPHGLQRIPE